MPLAETIGGFVAFCRSPNKGGSKRELLYSKLIYRKFEQVLKRAFPITAHLLQEELWTRAVKEFVAYHDSSTPFLWQMPRAFLDFICKNQWKEKLDLPFLEELLHFEWIEIEIFMMPNGPYQNPQGNFLYLNPDSCIVNYSYPVFEKKKFPRPMLKGNYSLFVFRHMESGEVHFISLSPLFQYVLQSLQEKPSAAKDLLKEVGKQLGLQETLILDKGEKFFNDLHGQGAIYRSKKNA